MSTTSSSRARRRSLAIGAAAALATFAACAAAAPPREADVRATTPAPESPRAARPVEARLEAQAPTAPAPVELRTVAVRRLARAEAARIAGERFAEDAREPLALEVETASPLGDLRRTSSPVIVLNGQVLADTVPVPPGKLIALLPDRRSLAEVNTVEVVWLGDEERTRTRKPLTFRAADVQ